jgi:DNA-binding CsgD family transcriptional regulator
MLRQALVQRRTPHCGVQLVGRFAVEMVGRPDSDLSRFIHGEVLERGHNLRLLLSQPASLKPGFRSRMARLMAEGTRIRLSSGPLPDLALVATDLAVVDTRAGSEQSRILVVRREATNALHQFQQPLWDHAAELLQPRQATAESVQLDPILSKVLQMLGSGTKDDTAARQLDVSVRTYRRHVAAILKSLGVSTRFEAGLRAAELGVLNPGQIRHQHPAPTDTSVLAEDAC